jgi:hypothetical protein
MGSLDDFKITNSLEISSQLGACSLYLSEADVRSPRQDDVEVSIGHRERVSDKVRVVANEGVLQVIVLLLKSVDDICPDLCAEIGLEQLSESAMEFARDVAEGGLKLVAIRCPLGRSDRIRGLRHQI